MSISRQLQRRRAAAGRSRRGATLMLFVLLTIFLVGMVAFAVETGRMYVVRSQLQKAVDAGAIAASLKMQKDPDAVDEAVAAAKQFIQLNRVGWLETVPDGLITAEAGTWNPGTHTFQVGGTYPNAVRVGASQNNEALSFAGVFGHYTFDVPGSAIAAGSGSVLDIMMVLDLSGSMGSGGRIEALRTAAPVFVNVIENIGHNDQIGVMGYGALPADWDPSENGSGTPYTLAPSSEYPSNSPWVGVVENDLTTNFTLLKNVALTTSNLQADKYHSYTPIGASIRDAAHYLTNSVYSRQDVEKVIVLMSDGEANRPTTDPNGYALQMAAYAAGLDIKVYTISLGDGADVNLMQQIAAATGAEHFDATGSGGGTLSEELTDAFYDAALTIKRTYLVR